MRGARWARCARVAAATLAVSAAVVGVGPTPAFAATAVRASAFGYWTSVSLFGGPSVREGFGQSAEPKMANSASPSVSLPAAGGSATVTDPDGSRAVYGPATVFGWYDVRTDTYRNTGSQSVTVAGTAAGSGTALAQATVNMAGPGPLVMDKVVTTCVRSGATRVAVVQVTNGHVETSTDPYWGYATTIEGIPLNPPPGLTIHGTINQVGDHFRIVFNEQTTNPDGSTNVVGAHMYLEGPIAVGDMLVAGATCGVTP
jgi:hypothetical protein